MWLRKLAGVCWIAAWGVALHAVSAPWRELGGLVDERLRWLEWFVLFAGIAFGVTIGGYARDRDDGAGERRYIGMARWCLYTPGALTAAGMLLLALAGQREATIVLLTALLAYWAGLDAAYGAYPLLTGRSGPSNDPRDQEAAQWQPPWERL